MVTMCVISKKGMMRSGVSTVGPRDFLGKNEHVFVALANCSYKDFVGVQGTFIILR